MTTRQWYNDPGAEMVFKAFEQRLRGLIEDVSGGEYEFTHMGMHRDHNTGEVEIRLHINPKHRINYLGEPGRPPFILE